MSEGFQALVSYGGLGILALFAYILLKATLNQQERLATTLSNHLETLIKRQIKRQEEQNQVLKEMVGTLKQMQEEEYKRNEKILGSLERLREAQWKKG